MANGNHIDQPLFDTGVVLKTCSRCKERKPFDQFSRKSRSRAMTARQNLQNWCKQCHVDNAKVWAERNPEKAARNKRHKHLLDEYRITLVQYERMLDDQGGKCAICRREEIQRRKGGINPLSVDHDHATGKVRSLLCHRCNVMLGGGGDNPSILRAAADYIEHHRKLQEERA